MGQSAENMSREHQQVAPPIAKSGDRSQRSGTTTNQRRWFGRRGWESICTGAWALAATAAAASSPAGAQLLEQQMQTLFFEARGIVAPPKDIVILAIDEASLSQAGQFFRGDPQQYADLEAIQAWPWQRSAYGTVVDRLMAAGAKAVAIDVIFSTPSSYGEADDQKFAQILQQHSQVVLAAQYSQLETPQGIGTQISTPLSEFCPDSSCLGFINFFLEPDGRIHRLGEQFLTHLNQSSPPDQAEALEQFPAFATSTLNAAQIQYPRRSGDSIFFYGPAQTFEQIPFWLVLDSNTWKANFQSGAYFKDKIVLIGSTASTHQDFHAAPFSQTWLYPQPMAGVEIHANAIATLLQGRSIAEALPNAPLRGLVVFIGVAASGWLLSRPKQPFKRLAWGMGLAIVWIVIGYGLFVQGRLIVPVAIPATAIAFSGLSQLIGGSIGEQLRKQSLRDTLKHYVTSPIVQEIISQQDDFHDLLRERELALSGKVLGGRYQIVRVLGSGGFSETYVAEDLQRPGNPYCVVKQLRVVSDDPNTLHLARRLFATEAETLERLGQHDQIPQLLASFEENQEFYLIQEFVQGHPLNSEILPKRSLPEFMVVRILYDLLEVLEFVHGQGVIHRDLKPSNIMRRQLDGRLVLIDFGVAKKITTQLAESGAQTKFTVSVGTPGYMPGEQSLGRPQFNSDIYALGMTALYALTGRSPHTFTHDPETGAVLWREQVAGVSAELGAILDRMIHHDFTQRYRFVREVRVALAPLLNPSGRVNLTVENFAENSAEELLPTETGPLRGAAGLPPTENSFDQTEMDSTIALPDAELPPTENPIDQTEVGNTIALPEDWMNP